MLYTTIALTAAAFAIWALVDVSRNHMSNQQKAVWFAVVILVPLVGPLVYYLKKEN